MAAFPPLGKVNTCPAVADISHEGGYCPRETAMANCTKSNTVISGELQLLMGVWALVCFAVLTTAALA